MRVEITAEAERNLSEITLHIAEDSPAAAADFLRRLRDACDGLSDFPERFPLVGRFAELAIRHRVVGNYLIFYRVESDRVSVLHVLHGAVDYGPLIDRPR